MYPNLLEAPCGENLYIVRIDNKKLAARLKHLEVGVDTSIMKVEPCGTAFPDVLIRCSGHPSKLKIPSHQARQVYVRTCEICWSCGECHPQEL